MSDSNPHEYLRKARRFLRLDKLPPLARKIVVFTTGGLLLIAGVIMLVTPASGIYPHPAGIADSRI